MAFSDSDPVEASIDLVGLWLHDPADPQDTARQYPYGSALRSDALEVEQEVAHYAGREHPLVEYGEPTTEAISVGVEVPHSSTWATDLADLRDFATLRRTVCLRDNRGRQAFGTLSGFSRADQEWGTLVSFTLTRVDYDEGDPVMA